MITLIFSKQSKLAQANLKKLLNQEHPERNEYNFISFDMGVTPIADLVDECELHTLTFDKKIVVAENCFFLDKVGNVSKKKTNPDLDKFAEYVKNPDPDTDLYLLVYVDTLDLSNPIIGEIKAKHKVLEVTKMDENQWKSYYKSYFVKRGYKVDDDAINELYTRIENDYALFLNEASKLEAYKLNEKAIEHCDVMTMVPPKIEENSILMCNCLTRNDISSAIRLYKDLKVHSTDEMTLIGMLTTQFIFYDKVKYLDSKGFSIDQIGQMLGLKNSKRVYMTLKETKSVTRGAISRILEELYQAESSILSGTVSQEFAFSRFLSNFSI